MTNPSYVKPDPAQIFDAVRKHYGEPLFQTRTDRPGILNEQFWAGLYRKEHDILFEPREKVESVSASLFALFAFAIPAFECDYVRILWFAPRKLSFAIVFFPQIAAVEAGETTGFQKCTLRTHDGT